jgi:hypothetical protein
MLIIVFLQTISEPQGEKKKLFAKLQEAARKDVERAFGVLQARFAIVSLPCRLWATTTMKIIMKAVIILHNMIIEDERDLSLDQQYERVPVADHYTIAARGTQDVERIIERFLGIRDEMQHYQLRNDLIEHLWQRKGEE